MGTKTPGPPVIGDYCPECDGVLWPAGETPKFIHAELDGLVRCPEAEVDPPNGTWVLQQFEITPCYFTLETETMRAAIYVHDEGDIIWVYKAIPVVPSFFMAHFILCESDYDNEQVECLPFYWAKGGTLHIDWG